MGRRETRERDEQKGRGKQKNGEEEEKGEEEEEEEQLDTNKDMEIDGVVDWLQLEKDALELIITRLTVLVDFIRFGAVCKAWRSIFLENRHRLPHLLPVLMIPGDDDKNNEFGSFFSLSEKKTYRLNKLPNKDNKKWCCGSSEGHLIMVDLYLNIFLLNPFSRTETPLPRLTSHPTLVKTANDVGHKYVHKAITAGPYVIAILALRLELAFCKRDSDTWTYVETDWGPLEDLVFYNSNFYVLSSNGCVGILDVNGPQPSLTMVTTIVERDVQDCRKYLVESAGQLLMVVRRFEDLTWDYPLHRTTSFKIFRVDVNKHLCFPLKALGDGMLFLGENSLVSSSAPDFSECEGNRIYFLNNESWNEDYYLREYNIEDGSFENHCRMDWKWKWPHPIWLTPKL